MTRFIAQRLLSLAPLLLAITLAVFSMVHLLPGDPIVTMLGEAGTIDAAGIDRLREDLGLNKPLHLQYLSYVGSLLRFDLGTSIRLRLPVAQIIRERLPSTLELAVAGLTFAVVMGVLLGIVSAIYHNTWIDNAATTFAVLGVSIPNYWLGLMLISLLSVRLGWLPVAAVDGWRGLILPAVTLGFTAAGPLARFTRSGMLESLGQDYIRTARSKGLRERRVVFRHALRNALIPVVTVVGIRFGSILAGTVIIEAVFARPGLGLVLLESIRNKDLPLIQGVILLISVAFVLVNLMVEILYSWIDPRIQYS